MSVLDHILLLASFVLHIVSMHRIYALQLRVAKDKAEVFEHISRQAGLMRDLAEANMKTTEGLVQYFKGGQNNNEPSN